ncbi:histidine phosphatase family protein [Agromyces protaetiae]|nr:histidine phosphatase family protein [Agromyces protaetiae]
MVIALVRHGQTDWNFEFRMQGRTDIPLNDAGRAQARAAVERFAPAGYDLVVSSTLGRARETASILAEGLGVPLGDAYDGLVEQEFGEAEGLLVSEFRERWPHSDIPGAEPNALVGARGVAALDAIAAEYEGRKVLAVAHGTLIRRTISVVTGYAADAFPRLENLASSRLAHEHLAWTALTFGDRPFDLVRAELNAQAA